MVKRHNNTKEKKPVTPDIVFVEMDNISISEFCQREGNETEIKKLAESIARRGLLQYPIALKQEDGSYLLVAGRRRFLACRKLGWQSIPLRIDDVSDKEAAFVAYEENGVSKAQSAKDKANYYRLLQKRFSMTQQDIAEEVGCAQSVVAAYLSAADLPADVANQISESEDGRFSFTHGSLLGRLMRSDRPHKEGEVRKLAQKCQKQKISTKQLKCLVSFIKKGKMDELPDELKEALLTNSHMTPRMAELYLEPENAIQGQSSGADQLRIAASEVDRAQLHRMIRKGFNNQENELQVAKKIQKMAEKAAGQESGPAKDDKPWSQRILDVVSGIIAEFPGDTTVAKRWRDQCSEKEIESMKIALEQVQRRLMTLKKALGSEKEEES